MSNVTGTAKLKAVTALVNDLSANLNTSALSQQETRKALEDLKIYGRDPTHADAIFTNEGIATLCRYAYSQDSAEISQAAMRVLANSLFLKPDTRQMFVSGGFAAEACHKLKLDSWDDEFLNSRILLLSTYGTSIDLVELIDNQRLADHVVKNLQRHADSVNQKKNSPQAPMETMALSETLKLLFNILHHCSERVSSFSTSVTPTLRLLLSLDIPRPRPLEPPLSLLINALMNLDLTQPTSKEPLFNSDDDLRIVSRLVDVLDGAMKAYSDTELDSVVSPLISLLVKVLEVAPRAVRGFVQGKILPSKEDREDVLGRGERLPAKLLRNSSNAMAPIFRDAVLELFFDLSDRDASRFVENVGYGFASGYLFQNNIPLPASAQETAGSDDAHAGHRHVNPITGQFLDQEKADTRPEMTQEEKEREAEKLFVLFERLKANGVIDVENPVATAVREGRYRELDEDEVEEVD